jgi:hypothetical protein
MPKIQFDMNDPTVHQLNMSYPPDIRLMQQKNAKESGKRQNAPNAGENPRASVEKNSRRE